MAKMRFVTYLQDQIFACSLVEKKPHQIGSTSISHNVQMYPRSLMTLTTFSGPAVPRADTLFLFKNTTSKNVWSVTPATASQLIPRQDLRVSSAMETGQTLPSAGPNVATRFARRHLCGMERDTCIGPGHWGRGRDPWRRSELPKRTTGSEKALGCVPRRRNPTPKPRICRQVG